MSNPIDVEHLGRKRVICAFEADGLIFDPGPATTVDTLLDKLEGEPRALMLTHVHLDHAGAAGVLCRRFPSLTVYVHERGAPHLADPSKLLKSAARLYGDDMERLWGEVAPVPEERIQLVGDGDEAEGMRVAYTPGHASHHVSYFDPESGEAYVGDVAGVRLPHSTYTMAPTPPPDIDVERWIASTEAIGEWEPQALCLTHFGRHEDVGEQLERLRGSLRDRAERAREMTVEDFEAFSEAEAMAEAPEGEAAALLQAAPPDQMGLGLRRYWDKRAEREGERT